MPAKILDGTAISRQILDELRAEVGEIVKTGKAPGLVTILVGNNPASASYVASKVKTAAESLGFHEVQINLPEETTEAELQHALIEKYNEDDDVHGILSSSFPCRKALMKRQL